MSSQPHPTEALPCPVPAGILRALGVLAQAMLVPLAVTLLGLSPFFALPLLDGSDRALVWIDGSEIAMQDAAARTTRDPSFAGAGARGVETPPTGCPAHATRLHFDFQRIDEAQVARVALERIATQAGATVCASNRFEINRIDEAGAVWLPLAVALLLPMALLAAVHASAGFPANPHATVSRRHAFPAIIAALATTTMLPLPGGISFDDPALPAGLAMALLPPAIHELAFRGWMMPRLAPAFGQYAAAGISLAASVVAAVPFADTAGIAVSAVIAAICCLTYLHTRSTPTCIAMHMLLAAIARAVAHGV